MPFLVFEANGHPSENFLNNTVNQKILARIDSSAFASASINLNKVALDKLLSYDRILDSLYLSEKEDTLAFLENNYGSATASKKNILDSLQTRISEVSIQKSEIEKTYKSLIKKALISFGLWLLIVIVILQIRKKTLAKSKFNFLKTNAQLKAMESSVAKAEQLFSKIPVNREKIDKLYKEFAKLSESFSSGKEPENLSPPQKYVLLKTEHLMEILETEYHITEAILLQSGDSQGEFKQSDINIICNLYTEIASRGLMNDGFNCQVLKDFEKNLPPIKISPTFILLGGAKDSNNRFCNFKGSLCRFKAEIFYPLVFISIKK